MEYALALINQDQEGFGLPPVRLCSNPAAQTHAEEMLENRFLSHWNRDGLKPYMRYTLAGGGGAVFENARFVGFFYEEPLAAPVEPRRAGRTRARHGVLRRGVGLGP